MTLNEILVAISLGCALITVVLLILWMRARGATGRAEARLAQLEATAGDSAALADTEARLHAAEARVRELEAHAWIDDFPPETVFTLVAASNEPSLGAVSQHGLVRDERGAVVPFLTGRDLGHLAPGDAFTSVRGALVKLDTAGRSALDQQAETLMFEAPIVQPAPADAARFEGSAAGTSARPPAAGAGTDQTMVIRPGLATTLHDPAAGLPYLDVIEGPDQGRRFPVSFGGAAIGREKRNHVALADSGASRVHCRIDYEAHGFVLRDNASTNGTLCNGQRVTEQSLSFGDVIHVAETRMRWTCDGFELRDRDPAAAIRAFEKTLEQAPDFVAAIKNLAFLLEKDIARKKEAQPLWERLARLES